MLAHQFANDGRQNLGPPFSGGSLPFGRSWG
jgi:hypothetical protein